MPFKSQAQRAYMYSQHPEMAKEWEKHTPEGELPEHVKKMSDGGIVHKDEDLEGSEAPHIKEETEFEGKPTWNLEVGASTDTAKGYADGGVVAADKSWADEVGDYVSKHFGKGSTTGQSDLKGFHSLLNHDKDEISQAENVDPIAPLPSTSTAQGFAGGGIALRDKAKSGPAINQVPHPNYADGGMPGLDDFSVNTGDSDTLKMNGANSSPMLTGALAGATPPTFDPTIGLPKPVSMTLPPPAQPIRAGPASVAPPPVAIPGEVGNPNAVGDYVAQQKAQLSQYGPEQQLALEKALQQQHGGAGQIAARGLGALGDAIMQGVARAGNPGFEKQINEEQQTQANNQRGAFQRAGAQNIQQTEAKMKLDAIDPTSGPSQAKQEAYTPLLKELGYSTAQINKMSSADIESATALMAQFGGKKIEAMIKQFELQLEARKFQETERHDVAEEGEKSAETKTKAAEVLEKGPTSIFDRILGNPTTMAQRGGAGNVLAKVAGVQSNTGVPAGRITVVSPTGQIGHIPESQLQAALTQGYKQQ